MSTKAESTIRIPRAALAQPLLTAPTLRAFRWALSQLDEREEAVLRLRYGVGQRPHDVAEVALSTGQSPAAVRRLQRLAFKKLRWLAADLDDHETRARRQGHAGT